MRIAILTSAYPPAVGGAETYARRLAEGLAARAHEVRVVTDDAYRSARAGAAPGAPEVRTLTGWRERLDDPALVTWEESVFGALPALEAALAGGPWDVLHANSFETALLARVLANGTGTPVAATYHEMLPLDTPLGMGRSRFAHTSGLFDVLIAGSEHYRDRALRSGAPRSAVRLVPHGVPDPAPTAGRDALRARLGYGADEQVVLLPGRFKERKGQAEFLSAFARLRRELPRARALLVGSVHSGSAAYLARLRDTIDAAGLGAVVRVLTDVSLDGMRDVYAVGDLVVVPSHAEGLGLVVLEAMAAVRPVLATRVTGIAEIVEHGVNGVLVPARSPDELARAALALLRDGERARRLAAAGRRTYLRSYALDRMLDATEAVYRELTGARGSVAAPAAAPATGPPPKRALSSRMLHETPWIRVRQDVVAGPGGERSDFTVVSRSDFVVVLPLTPGGEVVLVRQFRYAAGTWQLELPQGGREYGEAAGEAALRELKEETGYAGRVVLAVDHAYHEAADWAEQQFTIVHVETGTRGDPMREDSELGMETVVMPYREVMRAVRDGDITDPPTLAALCHVHALRDANGGLLP